ncbi:hypothetical protein [Phytoactinopolyspora mesophila]|uniref:Uncharacterized protein n=1 Tax=Phytoactinopolyspora mesophila TaxID=2650750 RepID=A0A7K3M2H9_9ACTN|nr:hypothetical protein [Phytoactinopolyspora mesophila]NDL57237.1 hypothetical protein [Phytoactinopolyspora mesophila]
MPGEESPALKRLAGPGFGSPEGLRLLLNRLDKAGPGAWRDDPEAARLMRFTATRYATLARRHRMEPDDAARAAFEVMLNESTRRADDPWAVVSVGVRATLSAEERAIGLLCSPEKARRTAYSKLHDAVRFGERDADPADYAPALHIGNDFDAPPSDEAATELAADAAQAVEHAVTFLLLLGWPDDVATAGTEYVCARLIEAGNRQAAYDALRRDKAARALLDLPHHAWISLLRVLIGYPGAPSPVGRLGILARLLIGDTVESLLADEDLVRITTATTSAEGGSDE